LRQGDTVFLQGESGNYMFVVQSGVIEVLVGDTLVEVRGPNEALGFMSVIDQVAPQLDHAGTGNGAAFQYRSALDAGDRMHRPHSIRDIYHGRNGAPHSWQWHEQRHLRPF
jgi:CRP-like cAMP-binding protein